MLASRTLSTIGLLGLLLAGLSTACAQGPYTVDLHAPSLGGVTLAGTLYVPEGAGPHPTLILTHGAEPGRRSHPGYIRWAKTIQGRGIACLVFDKRGVADSEGTYVEAPDLQVPAQDVLAWVNVLKTQPQVRPDAIGVLGWSQGGWTGPLAASQTPELAFIVSISGPGVSPLEQNIYDKTNQIRATGLTPAQEEQAAHAVRLVMTYQATGENEAQAQAAWDAVKDTSWFKDHYKGVPMVNREAFLNDPRSGHYVAHNTYDPVPILEQLQVPMLAVFGGADRVVPVETSIENMRAAFDRGGNPHLTIKVYPGGDHGIRVLGPDGNRKPAPGFQDFVLDWVLATVARIHPAADME